MNRLILFLLLATSCQASPTIDPSQISFYEDAVTNSSPDSILIGIEQKIYNAFVQSIMTQDDQKLQSIQMVLDELYTTKKQNLIRYWSSYLKYYHSIFYLKKADAKTAEQHIQQGIKWLEALDRKNSEDHALLSMMQGFAIQFNRRKTIKLSMASKENAQLALAIDSTNLRAHYVFASNDFYTPEQYGGGDHVEAHLKKAVSLPDQKIKNELLPSWGKEEAYEMLIKWYMRKNNWKEAKRVFQQANQLFPNNYQLNQLAAKLVGE